MAEQMRQAVEEYLSNNIDEALNLAREMHSYDGCYEWTDAIDFEILCEMAASEGAEAVEDLCRAVYNGNTFGERVRYNTYGNLEPAEESDLLADARSYLNDILDGLESYIDDDGYVNKYIDVSFELQEIIDANVQEEDEEGLDD